MTASIQAKIERRTDNNPELRFPLFSSKWFYLQVLCKALASAAILAATIPNNFVRQFPPIPVRWEIAMQDPRSYFVTKLSQPMRRPETVYSPATAKFVSAVNPVFTVCDGALSGVNSLPLEWILSEKQRPSLGDRLVADLVRQEAHETDPHKRADLRIAQITILKALRGSGQAFDEATLAVLHCHADEVWPRIVQNRKDKLGQEYYEWFDGQGNLRPDIPKFTPPPAVVAVISETQLELDFTAKILRMPPAVAPQKSDKEKLA